MLMKIMKPITKNRIKVIAAIIFNNMLKLQEVDDHVKKKYGTFSV